METDPSLHRRAAVAGVVAAGTALAFTELFAGVSQRIPSMVVAVSDIFVDGLPGDLVRTAIGIFGTSDKTVLLGGVVVVSLLVGARLGMAALARPWVAPTGFGLFALVGVLAANRVAGASVLLSLVSVLVSAGVAVLVLRGLLAAVRYDAARPAPPPADPEHPFTEPTRRTFLQLTGGVAAMAAGVGLSGRWLRERFSVESARAEVSLPSIPGSPTAQGIEGVSGLSPFITPNDEFYRIDTALVVPQVAPDGWTLDVTGMVQQPFTIDFDELLAMDMVEETITMACVSNEVGGDLVGNALWQGVPLRDLLERAGVDPAADQVVGRSVDGFTAGFPTEAVFDGRPALLAVGMNGEPLPIVHGFPARIVVAGLYGYVSATKWLSEIELTTFDSFDAYWIPRGWSAEGPVKTQSRIDVPRGRRRLQPGTVIVAGVAWAPTRGIERVEVQVDDDDWQEADLGPGTSDTTWRQWVWEWDAEPGEHTLTVRATDGEGDTQTEDRSAAAPNGATGWHGVSVRVEED